MLLIFIDCPFELNFVTYAKVFKYPFQSINQYLSSFYTLSVTGC